MTATAPIQRSLTTFVALALSVILARQTEARCSAQAPPTPGIAASSVGVLVSIPPQVWLVQRIGGVRTSTTSLLQPGDSAETYQPTDAEVSRALTATIYVPMGIPFESGAWAEALRTAPGLTVVTHTAMTEGPTDDHRHHDPHIWLSPRRLIPLAGEIATALSAVDPQGAEHYASNLRLLEAELEELDQELRSAFATWQGSPFLVLHPSWQTFATDYGLRLMAIEANGHEPSDRELTALLHEARQAAISTVFIQPEAAGRSAYSVAAVLGARVETLDPLARELPANLRTATRHILRSFEESSRRLGR